MGGVKQKIRIPKGKTGGSRIKKRNREWTGTVKTGQAFMIVLSASRA